VKKAPLAILMALGLGLLAAPQDSPVGGLLVSQAEAQACRNWVSEPRRTCRTRYGNWRDCTTTYVRRCIAYSQPRTTPARSVYSQCRMVRSCQTRYYTGYGGRRAQSFQVCGTRRVC
jgi:hypothetical protein